MLYGKPNPHGGDIYGEKIILDFSSNTNPFGTPQSVLNAMTGVMNDVCRYPDPYCRELVTSIAAYEGVPESFILCGNGAAELIYAFCGAVKARTAAEPAPTFSEYSLGLEKTGCKVGRYYLSREKDFEIDEGFVEYLEEQRPDAVFLCNPNNPTGRLVPPGILLQIMDLCGRNNSHLFLDECFLNLTARGISMKPYLESNPRLLILKAFTKCWGMAGVRLGYCLCSDRGLLSAMAAETQPWNVSVLAQAAGIAALKEEGFVEKARKLISEERPRLTEALEALDFQVCPSEANYILFKGQPGLDSALKKSGIAIRNCENYCGLGPGWYRIAVRLPEQNRQLIRTVELVLKGE